MSGVKRRASYAEDADTSSAKGNIKPERNLLAAILARAICDAFGTAQCDKHIVRSAHQWLFGALTPSKAFSFAWVAQHLDLEPVALQRMLTNYQGDTDSLQEKLSLLR